MKKLRSYHWSLLNSPLVRLKQLIYSFIYKKKFHLPFYYYLFIYTKTKNENKKLGDPSEYTNKLTLTNCCGNCTLEYFLAIEN